MPAGTEFLPFTKPGKIQDGMTANGKRDANPQNWASETVAPCLWSKKFQLDRSNKQRHIFARSISYTLLLKNQTQSLRRPSLVQLNKQENESRIEGYLTQEIETPRWMHAIMAAMKLFQKNLSLGTAPSLCLMMIMLWSREEACEHRNSCLEAKLETKGCAPFTSLSAFFVAWHGKSRQKMFH